MAKYFGVCSFVFAVSALPLAGCYVQAGAGPVQPGYVESAPPPAEAAPEYYYGGAHFYPAGLGGEWCPIAEPHVHDFPPDHPEWYAYDSGYYYYSGRPGEVYVVGSVPPGARVHVVHEGEAHGWRRLPPAAPRAPYAAGGHYPTRADHPAPAQPVPVRRNENQGIANARAQETREAGNRAAPASPAPEEHGPAATTPAAPAAPRPTGNERREPTEGQNKSASPAAEPSVQHPAPTKPAPSKPAARPAKRTEEKKDK